MARAEAPPNMRLRGITVLIVEDDLDNLELIATYVEDEGARALSANSLATALSLASDARVDVVVSDLELSDGDGCELLQKLRQRDGSNEVPAIAITGYSELKW